MPGGAVVDLPGCVCHNVPIAVSCATQPPLDSCCSPTAGSQGTRGGLLHPLLQFADCIGLGARLLSCGSCCKLDTCCWVLALRRSISDVPLASCRSSMATCIQGHWRQPAPSCNSTIARVALLEAEGGARSALFALKIWILPDSSLLCGRSLHWKQPPYQQPHYKQPPRRQTLSLGSSIPMSSSLLAAL